MRILSVGARTPSYERHVSLTGVRARHFWRVRLHLPGEFTERVDKLLSGKAPEMDEIRLEMLKALDVVGLSWLTHLCNVAWTSATVPLA